MQLKNFQTIIESTVIDILDTSEEDEVSTLMQVMFHQNVFQEAIRESEESKKLRKEISSLFRTHFSPVYPIWGFLNHALTKPFGYPGDYEVFEYLYDKRPHINTPDKYVHLDHYLFSLSLYRSTIERKNILKYVLALLVQDNPSMSICSIGCGGARELRELESLLEASSIALVDFDPRALSFAYDHLKPHADTLETICMNATHWSAEGRVFDVIYSFGLFDYLSDNMLNRLMKGSVKSLEAGGKYIFALKDYTQFDTHFYYFLGDVEFQRRTVEDGLALARKHNLVVDVIIPTESRAINVFVCSHADAI